MPSRVMTAFTEGARSAAVKAHRAAALEACAFLIDWLKTKAPFWKREEFADGDARWVAAKNEDDAAAARWSAKQG